MAEPIAVKKDFRIDAKITSPMAQLQVGEDFDCNESEWKGSVAGLTTYALRNAASLDSEYCAGANGILKAGDVEDWFSLFSVDATPIGGGRTWNAVAAHYNATRVGGNLICHEEDADDFQDNDDHIRFNMGAQRSGNASANQNASIDIDNDFNADEHGAIAAIMDAIKMPSYSDRLVYYFGSDIPQGFLCSLYPEKLDAYVKTVKSVLSEANHGFVKTTEGWAEKMDGVLTFVSAFCSETHDQTDFNSAMLMMSKLPGWEEFANVLHAGRAYRESLEGFEALKVAYEVAKKPDGDMAPVKVEWTMVKGQVDAALGAIGICDENLLNEDQKEVRFMIENELMNMLAALNRFDFVKDTRRCIPDGFKSDTEQCDPKIKADTCGEDKHCNNKCKCVSDRKPDPIPGNDTGVIDFS